MKVLVFEDEAIVALNLKSVLLSDSSKHQVNLVSNLSDFKKALTNHKFDLAFLDINIDGKLIGLEAGKFLRDNYNMGLVYLTAYSSPAIVEQLSQNIPDAYLTKPFDETHIINISKQVFYKYNNKTSLGQISIMQQDGRYLSSKIELNQELIDQIYIVSITDAEGKIIFVNDAFCNVSGFSKDELLNRNHKITNSKYHSADFFLDFWSTIKAGKIWHGEIRNQNKNQIYYWIESYVFALDSDSIEKKNFVSIGHDITVKKIAEQKLEDQLRKKNHDLVDVQHQFNRLTKDNSMIGFNSILVHELKKPLSTIVMQTELILDRYGSTLPEPAFAKIKTFHKNATHIVTLINYLNATFRRTKDDKKILINLVRQIELIVDFIHLVYPVDVPNIEFRHSDEVTFISGYEDSIFLSLFNLLKNACEAFDSKQADKMITICLVKLDRHIAIDISDNKIGGIPMHIVNQLFLENFVSEKKGGSGFGLNISRQTLASMDAEIELLSTGDEGSTFRVSVPIINQK